MIKTFESFVKSQDLFYRGLSDGGTRNFKLQTWTKDKEVAKRYALVPPAKHGSLFKKYTGKILVAHLHFQNPIIFPDYTSQVNSTHLLKYFSEKEIRNILKDIEVRDYTTSIDGIEKKGIKSTDELKNIEFIVFDFIDHDGFEELLRKHGYDAVVYLGWEGDGSLEYRTFDENIELLDSIEV